MSTGTKNAACSDVLYVEEPIGPKTVALGIDPFEITAQLEADGIDSFAEAFDRLLAAPAGLRAAVR